MVAGRELEARLWVGHGGFQAVQGGAQCGKMALCIGPGCSDRPCFVGVHVMECIFQILIFAFSVTIPYNKIR